MKQLLCRDLYVLLATHNDLNASQTALINDHIAGCSSCAIALAEQEALTNLLSTMDAPKPVLPKETQTALNGIFAPPSYRHAWRRIVVTVVIAGIALVALFGYRQSIPGLSVERSFTGRLSTATPPGSDETIPPTPRINEYALTNDPTVPTPTALPYGPDSFAVAPTVTLSASLTISPMLTLKRTLDLEGDEVAIHGEILYVLDRDQDSGGQVLHIFNIAGTDSPHAISTLPLTHTQTGRIGDLTVTGSGALDLTISENRLLMINPFGFQWFDISTPDTPQWSGAIDVANIQALAIQDQQVYVLTQPMRAGEGPPQLMIFDISSRATHPLIGSRDLHESGGIGEIVVASNFLYVAGKNLDIYDVADPTNVHQVASTPFRESSSHGYDLGNRSGIAISGSRIYLTTTSSLWIIDVNDPGNPIVAGRYHPMGLSYDGFVVAGDIVYVATISPTYTSPEGIDMIDVRNPGKPTLVGQYQADGSIGDVAVRGSQVYVSHRPYGVLILEHQR